jgi:hypothetical protein
MRHSPATKADLDPAHPRAALLPCGCGRLVLPMHLVHVADVPATVFGGAEYVCDGCWDTARLTGAASTAALVHYTGGHPDAVTTAQAFDARERGQGNLPLPASRPQMVRSPRAP